MHRLWTCPQGSLILQYSQCVPLFVYLLELTELPRIASMQYMYYWHKPNRKLISGTIIIVRLEFVCVGLSEYTNGEEKVDQLM